MRKIYTAETGAQELIDDVLLNREYDHDHTPLKAPAEDDYAGVFPEIAAVIAKFGIRAVIAKLTGGLC